MGEQNHIDSEQKLQMLDRVMEQNKKRFGQRLIETREIFDQDIIIGDIHTHSIHSDGRCTVDELKAYADMAALDFFFVTDHNSIQQADDCAKYQTVWAGQEPGCADHHIGLLSPSSLFVPDKTNFIDDWRMARNISEFTWIPHPTGWTPTTYYTQQQMNELFKIDEHFAMEVLNGVFKFTDVFDQWQVNSIALWDQLLCANKHVTALAGSDAHFAAGIGCAWTGLFQADCSKNTVLHSLNAGKTIASEAPMLKLSINNKISGEEVIISEDDPMEITMTAADSLGLAAVNLIEDGRIKNRITCEGKTKFELRIRDKYTCQKYCRLECISVDYKHAFTTPVYFKTPR